MYSSGLCTLFPVVETEGRPKKWDERENYEEAQHLQLLQNEWQNGLRLKVTVLVLLLLFTFFGYRWI
jgi:hypothetical protein